MLKELYTQVKAVDVFDKGANVQFEDAEVEAFAPARLLEKKMVLRSKKVKKLNSK